MAYTPEHLSDRIFYILRAPGIDFDSISAKRVRNQLLAQEPSLDQEIRDHKKEIDDLIISCFHLVRAELLPEPQEPDVDHAPVKRKRESPEFDDAGPPSSAPMRQKKVVSADEEYARRLDDAMNGDRKPRTARPKKSSGSSRKTTAFRSTGAKVKSDKYIYDSDDESPSKLEDEDSESFGEDPNDLDHKPPKKARKRAAPAEDGDEPKKKRGGGFNKEWALSAPLSVVCGTDRLSRPQVVKHIWQYVKANQMQDPRDGRKIICDENLTAIFGTKSVNAFGMNKHIGKLLETARNLHAAASTKRTHNSRLLISITDLIRNIEAASKRLQVRAGQLSNDQVCLLDSLAEDYASALSWLAANQNNLCSKWTVADSIAALEDLDKRLCVAFARKLSFSLLGEISNVPIQISSLQDDLPTLINYVLAQASRNTVAQLLSALQEEERASAPRNNGFGNNEAEKIIAHLIDIISNLEDRQQSTSTLPVHTSPKEWGSPSWPPLSTDPERPLTIPANGNNPLDLDTKLTRIISDSATSSLPRPTSLLQSDNSSRQSTDELTTVESRTHTPIANNILGFNPIDSTTKLPLIDPVLCADGLVHDRWQILAVLEEHHLASKQHQKNLTILGDVVQLRDLLWEEFPDRKVEYFTRRQTFRDEALSLCGPVGHSQVNRHIWTLTQVMQFEPDETAIHLYVRRGIANYRLRKLQAAADDFDKALDVSFRLTRLRDIDALRYRAMLRHACHDPRARRDVDQVLSRKRDPLAYALRASLRASSGSIDTAVQDIAKCNQCFRNQEQSEVALDNLDLVSLCRGWAYAAVGDYQSAISDFDAAVQARHSAEPYALTSRGLAQIWSGSLDAGFASLSEAFAVEAGEPTPFSPVSAVSSLTLSDPPEDPITFDMYFLRAMAFYVQGKFEDALADFEKGIEQRPSIVRDTGELRFVIGCVRAQLGDVAGAQIDFDFACAMKPAQREAYRLEELRLLAPDDAILD